MASHKSAFKRIKQILVRAERNRTHRTKLGHQIRKLRTVIKAKDKGAAVALLKPTISLIDHSVHKGIIHRNAAARYKSRLTLKVKGLA